MTSFEQAFTLHVPSSTENLSLIREFITRIASQAGMDENEVAKLELAVDEACANVIEHAYGHDSTKQVVVRARFDEDTLRIEVVDTGLGFNPNEPRDSDIQRLAAERRTGGLGMRLMKTIMDEVHYDMEPGRKNELTMVKKLNRK